MSHSTAAGPHWSTASLGVPPGTSAIELSALGEHLALCKSLGGRLLSLKIGVQTMHAFSASHMMTTVVVMSSLVLAGSLLAT